MAVAVPSHVGSIDGSLGISAVVEGIELAVNTPNVSFITDVHTASFTATPAQIAGATPAPDDNVFLALTGTAGAGVALTLPTVASLAATLQNLQAGQSWILRVINTTSQTVTMTTNTGWTLNGTMTLLLNTFRDFVVTMTSSSAAVLQSVGSGVAP